MPQQNSPLRAPPPSQKTSHGRILTCAHRSVASSSRSGRSGTGQGTISLSLPPPSSQPFSHSLDTATSFSDETSCLLPSGPPQLAPPRPRALLAVCVISYLYPATCSLKGYGSGSAAAEATAVGFFGTHILSQTGLACPSRAPLSPSPPPYVGLAGIRTHDLPA